MQSRLCRRGLRMKSVVTPSVAQPTTSADDPDLVPPVREGTVTSCERALALRRSTATRS